jgi:hypothetical protein
MENSNLIIPLLSVSYFALNFEDPTDGYLIMLSD